MDSKLVIKGTAWTTIATIVSSIVQILRLAILTRFLDKADFGIVAIISFVLGLITTFGDLGFSSAIMYKRDLSRNDFSSLYWIQFIVFGVMFLLALLFTPLFASFYDEPHLLTLIPISLIGILFLGIGRLYDTVLQREMMFKILAVRTIVSAVVSLLIAVVLAYYGTGVYSLVLSTLSQTLIFNVWNYISGQKVYRLRLYLVAKDVIPLVKIGLYQTGTQFFDYISSRLDILIIGKLLGEDILGVYNLAKELVLKIVSVINSIGNKVALPFFSLLQKDHKKMGAGYCQMMTVLSILNFPICTLTGAFSLIVVNILYGGDYLDVAPVLTILSIWGLLVCVGNPVGNIVTATGRTDLSFAYVIIRLFIVVPLTYLASQYSIIAVSFAVLIGELIIFFISWYMELWMTIKLSFLKYIFSFIKLFVLSTIFIIIGFIIIQHESINYSLISWEIVTLALVITAIYLGFAALLEKKQIKELITKLRFSNG